MYMYRKWIVDCSIFVWFSFVYRILSLIWNKIVLFIEMIIEVFFVLGKFGDYVVVRVENLDILYRRIILEFSFYIFWKIWL